MAGKCTVLEFDDSCAPGGTVLGVRDNIKKDTLVPVEVSDQLAAGGGTWQQDNPHLFYFRVRLHGLGKNWLEHLSKVVGSFFSHEELLLIFGIDKGYH